MNTFKFRKRSKHLLKNQIRLPSTRLFNLFAFTVERFGTITERRISVQNKNINEIRLRIKTVLPSFLDFCTFPTYKIPNAQFVFKNSLFCFDLSWVMSELKRTLSVKNCF